VQDYSWNNSHWQSDRSLSDWLTEEKIPGIYDIDTRALTKHLRDKGSMLGKIIIDGCDDVDFYDPNKENLVAKTSCKDVQEYGEGEKLVVLVDCGVKHNIVRCLTKRGVRVVRVPWDYDFTSINYDGLFISNGPGDPDMATATVENIRKAIEIGKPICGICMGNQLLSKAAGAKTYKLKYGHRSHNQPVRRVGTNTCFVTSQNHGFAVDSATLPADWEPLFVNMNDGTNEGIRHKTKPFFSAQFHPEASSGPRDTEFLFDEFIALL
jgi:carbamoyl-phosphate synthase small subunit